MSPCALPTLVRMDTPDPRIAFVPPGWVWPAASKKRLALLPAEMFNSTFERAPDDWLHVAPLKKPPLFLTLVTGVITLFLGWVVISVLLQAGTTPAMEGPIPYVIAGVFGLIGLFFLISFVSLLFASREGAIHEVWVRGTRVVENGTHPARAAAERRVAIILARILAA